jgi:hypothetical protein
MAGASGVTCVECAEGSAVSSGHCNRSSSINSIGFLNSSLLRGRSLSSWATQSRSVALWIVRSVPFGKYWRSSGVVPRSWTPNLGSFFRE